MRWVLLWVVALIPSLAGSGAFALVDVDEPRFATASRDMLPEGADRIVPHFNGRERFDKPILIYWVQAAAMALVGPGELGARLPSGIAVATCAPLLAAIAHLLGLGFGSGALAGLMLVTTAQAQVMAHGATADAWMLAVVVAVAWAQIRRFVRGPALWSYLGMWGGCAAAFLTKGPPALVAPGAVAAGLLWAGARPRARSVAAGVALAAGLVLAWAVPALVRTEGRFWTEGVLYHVVERSLRPFEGHGGFAPWWYLFYLVVIPLGFLPWTPFLFAAVPVLTGRLRPPQDGAGRILAAWAGGVLVVFTLVTSKLPHYVLPAYPPLCVAAAAGLSRRNLPRGVAVVAAVTGVLLAIVLPAAMCGLRMPRAIPAAVAAGAVLAAGCLGAAGLLRRGAPRRAAGALAVGAFLGLAVLFGRVAPAADHYLLAARVKVLLAPRVQPGDRFHSLDLVMPSLTFYLGRPVRSIAAGGGAKDDRAALEVLERPGEFLITRARRLPALRAALERMRREDPARAVRPAALLEEPYHVLDGWFPPKGKWVRLLVLGRR